MSEIKKDVIFESDCLFFGSGETEGYYEIKPETLCRCAGARDCNGNYIFENDILLEHDIYRYKCYWDDKRCEFRLKAVGYSLSMSVLEERRIEIIGNTIENSNLYYKEDAPLNKHSEIVDVHTCNYRHNSNSRDNELCCRCDSRQTNADRIRNMSDEELAELITGSLGFDCAYYCDDFAHGCAFNCGKKGREIALNWLQSEAE